jgi:hypothetical protein
MTREPVRTRRLLVALSVVAASFCGYPGSAVASASARGHETVATGEVTCKDLTGSVIFTPPLRRGGTEPSTQVLSIFANHCSTAGSNVPEVDFGTITFTLKRDNNSCSTLQEAVEGTMTETWEPSWISPSQLQFGSTWRQNGAGYLGMVLPAIVGGLFVTGSFADTLHGRATEGRGGIEIYSHMTGSALIAACTSGAGLPGLCFLSGRETIPALGPFPPSSDPVRDRKAIPGGVI